MKKECSNRLINNWTPKTDISNNIVQLNVAT